MISQKILILTLIRFFKVCHKESYMMAIFKFRRARNSGYSHAGTFSGTLLFYEPKRNYLYSGDLIYKGSLDAFYPTTDPQLFYQSIRRIQKYKIKKVLPGHHQLDIPVSLIADIEAGFAKLSRAGKLKQGNGLFEFRDFQIHI